MNCAKKLLRVKINEVMYELLASLPPLLSSKLMEEFSASLPALHGKPAMRKS
jgi:hypothetical protein